MAPHILFNTKRQRLHRERRQNNLSNQLDGDFLSGLIADDIIARLDLVTRPISKAAIIGNCPPAIMEWCKSKNIQTVTIDIVSNHAAEQHIICDDWDHLPQLPFQPDLIINIGVLDAANDVPGLLIQLRNILRPDGLFLAGFLGGGSLNTLKRAMLIADDDQPRAHIHPQIDVRAAGDLMSRAGFAMPVADLDSITINYRNIKCLLSDIRNFGGGNALNTELIPFGLHKWQRLVRHWDKQALENGKTPETFAFISLSGWAPSPDQPKPAKRGSAKVSLASQLGKKPDRE